MCHVTFFLDGLDENEMTCDIKPDQYTYLRSTVHYVNAVGL